MSANERQVGGSHYVSSYIHWDFVLRTGMDYLAGNATKYVTRYDTKGKPFEDLEKAVHYIDKLVENVTLVLMFRPKLPPNHLFAEALAFCDANQISGDARSVIVMLTTWTAVAQVKEAKAVLQRLIGNLPIPPAKPVPLEDSNKHVDRSTPL